MALLAVLFAVSGATHLVRPELFKPLMPAWVPAHDEVILGSGLAELACTAGLLVPATRRSAGLASAALLVAVFPGNLKMALDSTRTGSTRSRMVSLGRLPLQLPLIRVALRAGLGRPRRPVAVVANRFPSCRMPWVA